MRALLGSPDSPGYAARLAVLRGFAEILDRHFPGKVVRAERRIVGAR